MHATASSQQTRVDDVLVDVVDVLLVVGAGHVAGGEEDLRRNTLPSDPSFTTSPPNSLHRPCVLSVVTTTTGDMLPFRSTATCGPLQTAFVSTPLATTTTLQVAPVPSLYR